MALFLKIRKKICRRIVALSMAIVSFYLNPHPFSFLSKIEAIFHCRKITVPKSWKIYCIYSDIYDDDVITEYIELNKIFYFIYSV